MFGNLTDRTGCGDRHARVEVSRASASRCSCRRRPCHKRTWHPRIGPKIHPTPLHDWAGLIRDGGVPRGAEDRRIRVRNRLQERQAGGDDADAEEERLQKAGDLQAGMNQKPPTATSSSPAMIATLVSQPGRQPARRDGHQEIAQIVRTAPRPIATSLTQLLLEVLVHHVDHAVAESPQRNSELTRTKVKATFRPSSKTNMPCLSVCSGYTFAFL